MSTPIVDSIPDADKIDLVDRTELSMRNVAAAERFDWEVAIFGVNEAATIDRCITAIDQNVGSRNVKVSVLLNGTTDDSIAILNNKTYEKIHLAVYFFPETDKANAINCFIHELREPADLYFFMDAYTKIAPGALEALAGELQRNRHAHMATGIPLNGRSAKSEAEATLRGRGVNGQLFAMKPSFADQLVEKNFRIPLGIYRGDPLLSSMAMHNLDALNSEWDLSRVAGVAGAGFEIAPLSPFRFSDIKRQFRREIRQARGRMENEAIKSIIYRHNYSGLPEYASDMIKQWLEKNKFTPESLKERVFHHLAVRELRTSRKLSDAGRVPRLLRWAPPMRAREAMDT